jgi:hypothetical protein
MLFFMADDMLLLLLLLLLQGASPGRAGGAPGPFLVRCCGHAAAPG